MAEILVVNASPLVFLGNAGRLELLRLLDAGRILVPQKVFEEVTVSRHADRAS
jgi:predicted nucleic acid-binding protein